MASQSSILKGIKVVDFGHYVAGPMAGMLLADHGADVIKIDPPGGPVYASAGNAMWNRNKRSIALDLRVEADRVIARQLMAEADVVIENFRPGRMAAWGLADADVRPANPGLIYLSLPGFASTDPRSANPVFDGTIYAATDGFRPFIRYYDLGVQSTTMPTERPGDPLPNPDNIPSAYGAVLGCNCVIAALLARRRSGLGQAIEVPLMEAMMQGLGVAASAPLPPAPRVGKTFTPTEIQYECADGRWFVMICSIPSHGEALFRYLGREDFIERGFTGKTGFEILGMPEAYEEMYAYLTEVMRTRTSTEWEAVFHELGLPGSIVRTTEEFLASDLVEGTDVLVEAGDMTQPNSPVILSRQAPFRPQPARDVDADRSEVLAGLGRQPVRQGAVDYTQLVRPPLDEIKVVDLCVILAGPVAGRTLAEFGAQVVKIDDPVRGANSFHDDVNRGKASLFVNLREPDGIATFWKLAEEADVIAQNFCLGALDKYGITEAEIRRRNPNAIWVATNAYGDQGKWGPLPGYEGSVQAASGLQDRYTSAARPGSWPYAVHDYLTGYITGFGTLLALYARETTGAVHFVHAALVRTATFLQSEAMMERLNPKGVSRGTAEPLFEALVRCSDEWVQITGRTAARVAAAFGLDAAGDLAAAIKAAAANVEAATFIATAHAGNVAAHKLDWVRAIMADPALQERGVSEIQNNHAGVLRCYVTPGPWMALTPLAARKSARRPGSGEASFLGSPAAAATHKALEPAG